MTANYSEESIKTLDWREHIRKRPGMYIGKLGDGSSPDDGIYLLLKEVLDNSIDEYMMGFGKIIEVDITEEYVKVNDYGRGVPLGKLVDVASKMNTGAKYDSKVFKKSVGLNGVGIKAVNALSRNFQIESAREGKGRHAIFERGVLIDDGQEINSDRKNGTSISFYPDSELFGKFRFIPEYVESMIKYYIYLNAGLKINYNGNVYVSKNGLVDLLNDNINEEGLYPIIHLQAEDIEVALTHGNQYGEEYFSFVNGQYTTQGGTHLIAFREALVKTVREFYKKDYDPSDIRASVIAAISIKVEEPVFESQTKTKLGSKDMGPEGPSVRNFIVNFLSTELNNYLHKNPAVANALLRKIQDSEKERKAISGIQKLARDRAKKANLHNKKLRDCRAHYNSNHERKGESTIFITEGDSASGSITKSRDVNTQAVFSLKGKPLNTYGLTKKIVYENEEFNLLQSALNIEESLDDLRYKHVVIATDADVDGMHIRLLLITFFLQFFPNLVRKNHLYVLKTPLFRVRNKTKTIYCYNEVEKRTAIEELGKTSEITRFKGLGEISPDEFKYFIGEDIRLEPVRLHKDDSIPDLLSYYMGKNTPERQDFIIENLRIEDDLIEEDFAEETETEKIA
ncbi:MAG: type IIA DNA topoisomerase subunit B [Bacteroidales bacterium]|nr:type IIA DNA topoisomerase subunit B [Bacteroidales bacterium]MCF8390227.1 type IIA DNA topoisomerase subunit B [Bacteroidales bacterium]